MKPSSRLGDMLSRQLLFLDGPAHARLRPLVVQALSGRRIRGLIADITALAEQACGAPDRAVLDVVRDVACPVPLAVVGLLLGLPSADYDDLRVMSDAYTRVITGIDRTTDHATLTALESFIDFALDVVRYKRRHPADDATSELIAAADTLGGFDDMDLAANLVMLVASGHQTTSGFIAGAVLNRLGPAADRRFEPFDVEAALAEVSPSRFIGRTASEDVRLSGRLITAGQSVLVLLASVNRAYADHAAPHIAFGHGSHRCPGALLARLEGRLVVDTVLKRWHDAVPATDTVHWSDNINLPRPESLLLIRLSRRERRNLMTAPSTFLDVFRQHVHATPDAPALIARDSTLTYGELDLASDRLAAVLRERGVLPQEAVAISVPRVDVAICAVLAAMKARAVVLLLDPEHPHARRLQQVTYARCVVVVSDDEHKLTHATPNVSPAGSPTVATAPAGAAAPGDAAYIVYTSGSTGTPKGVVCSHASLANVVQAQRRLLGVRPDDRVAANAPVTVDAFFFEITLALGAGASLHVPDTAERRAGPPFRRFLTDRGITVLVSTPTKLRSIEPSDHEQVRLVISAGEALDIDLSRRWAPRRRLVNAYGPTETTIWVTIADITGTEREIPLGNAIPGCRVELLRPDLTAADVGEVGELYISGAGLMIGYLHDPRENQFIDTPHGRAYRTGDRAVRRADGSLIFVGRDDEQVKVSGFRIELGEVRHHLLLHPQVRDAAVRVDNGRLVAYTTSTDADAAPTDPDDLRRFLESVLPQHMVPTTYIWLDAMPETGWGKVDIGALPSPAETVSRSGRPPGRPVETPIQQFLVDTVGELLDKQVEVDDDLFMLGLNSISVARLMTNVNNSLKVELEHIEVFDNPTIAELAAHIAERSTATTQALS
jgi:amino acid adenylation domain-containing protein